MNSTGYWCITLGVLAAPVVLLVWWMVTCWRDTRRWKREAQGLSGLRGLRRKGGKNL